MDFAGIMNYRCLRFVFPLLLITIAVYFASSLFVFYIDLKLVNYSPHTLHEPVAGGQTSFAPSAHKEYKNILERNLFAVRIDESADLKDSDLIANLDKLALTSLNCALIGTVINEGGDSWAIIKDNQSNREEKLTVGSLFSGAKVKMILRNKVVLHFNGKDELLVMGIERIRADRLPDEKTGKEDSPREIASYKISKDFISRSIIDLPKIMTTVRFKPYIKDGKPLGFQISRMKKGSPLMTMGFQDGDIVKSVNGQDILSPEDAKRVYNSLKDSNFFSVKIVRGHQLKTLNYKVR